MSNGFASTLNAAMGILKIYYAGPIVSQFNDEIPLYKGAEKGKEKWNGLQINRPLKVRRNPGIGATTDGGPLPSIGFQTTVQANIVSKYNYLRFGITGPMIKSSQGDKGSFVSIMEYEMEQGLIDLKNDVNRQLFWNGEGRLAVLSAAAIASNVITVTGRTSGEAGNKYLDIGVVIDIYSSGVLVGSGLTITAISGTTTATVTLSAPVTASAADIVVRTGAYNNEIQGITTILDNASTTVYGIDRSLYPIYNGTYVDAAGGQLQLDIMQRTLNEIRRKGGGKMNALFTDFDSERYYNKLLVADKRYVGGLDVKGDGTFTMKDQSYLSFSSIPVIADKDCPGQNMFMMSAEGWKKYVLCELEWADESGAYLIAQTGADAYEARLRLFANMFPEKPANMARLLNYISP